MLYLALVHDLITVDQAIAISDGLTPLLREPARGMFNLTNGSYLLSNLGLLLHGESSNGVPSAIEAFETVGKFLIMHPRTPWASQPIGLWSTYGGGRERRGRTDLSASHLSPTAYLGAAATLLISAESNKTGLRVPSDPSRLGPLNELYSYIQRRQIRGTASARLPELPVPDKFKGLFKSWAEDKTDFTSPA